MKINTFEEIKADPKQIVLYDETITNNPYIKLKPYPRQAWAIIQANKPLVNNEPNRILVGAGGYGGKSVLGAMLAAQFLDVKGYTVLVTRKNRKELKGSDSIWKILKEWTCDPHLEYLSCTKNENDLVIKSPYGAEIYFKPFDDESSKQKVKGESYDRIINDEASEIRPRILKFLYRSLRSPQDAKINIAMINLSNPGGPSTNYLTKEFVDGTNPFFSLSWQDNPFINKEIYSKTLNNLDFIDQKYQKEGDWHYKPAKGDMFNEKILQRQIIPYLPDVQFIRNVRGLDLAITKKGDRTIFVKILMDEHMNKYIVDVKKYQTIFPEEKLFLTIDEDNPFWQKGEFESEYYCELEGGSSGPHQKRYIKNFLQTYVTKGLHIKWLRSLTNKFTRARPLAREFNEGKVFILKAKWNESFIKEFKDFGPNPREYDNDDQVDATSIAFTALNKKRREIII